MLSRTGRMRPVPGRACAAGGWVHAPTPLRSKIMLSRPDILVLGGGGVLGEAWMMGVLAGIEDETGVDLRRCEHFVGTSAGAIVAAHPVARIPTPRPSTVSA